MRAFVELSGSQSQRDWEPAHARGLVPTPPRTASTGWLPTASTLSGRKPVVGRVSARIARGIRSRTAGTDWWSAAGNLASRDRRSADVVLCWDEYRGIPAALRRFGIIRRPVVTGVVWLVDPPVPRLLDRQAGIALRRCAAVWVSNEPMLSPLCQRFGLSSHRVHFVPLGIDTDYFTPLPVQQVPGLVVSAGNDRHRDFSFLLEATRRVAAQRPDVRLELATVRPVDMERGLGRVVGEATGADVRDMYARSEVVAVATRPNLHASGLTVALEAMASGRPVVISAQPGLDHYVEHGVTGLLTPPGDVAAFADALLSLLANPVTARRMGLQGRRRAETLFSSDVQAARLATILQQI